MIKKKTKYYTVYRTQNFYTGKYYFGVHKTNSPYDDYLGSGTILKRAIAKYGRVAFQKNVCFIFDNPEEAFAKEFELIEAYRADPLCYNLRQGGSGGFDYINANDLCNINNKPGREAADRELKLHPEKRFLSDARYLLTDEVKERSRISRVKVWQGKKHTSETLALISASAKERIGAKNSQYGSCWITDGVINKKVKKDQAYIWLETNWRLGRIV